MSRPRKDQDGPSAIERMQEAFWVALEEKPYSQITIGEITRRSEVNKNTFYYHYHNLDDLASKAIEGIIPSNVITLFLQTVGSMQGQPQQLKQHLYIEGIQKERIQLLVGKHGSNVLLANLKQQGLHSWLALAGVDEADLSWEEFVFLKFSIGGLFEVAGSEECFEEVTEGHYTSRLLDTPLARTVLPQTVAILKNAAARKASLQA